MYFSKMLSMNMKWIITLCALLLMTFYVEKAFAYNVEVNNTLERRGKADLGDTVKPSWSMHLIDPDPPAGADGAKFADVNGDGLPDLVSGFEEGGVSRIYIHPAMGKVDDYWDYVELPSPDVEDAVLVDVDGDGNVDLVTASEGHTNHVRIHWAPNAQEDYLDSEKWTTEIIPAVDGLSAWMFVVPVDMDGEHGVDLLVGSKRKRGEGDDKAIVGWLRSPKDPRNMEKWQFYPLTTAGWIMSMEVRDVNEDQQPDIIISDRRNSAGTGIRWLENPGNKSTELYEPWRSHKISVDVEEPMFHISADMNSDGKKEILVPDLYRGLTILKQVSDNPVDPWSEHVIPYPSWAGPRGKSVAVGDLNLDGEISLALSFEEEGKIASVPFDEYKKQGKYSVIRGSYHVDPIKGEWEFESISGLKGRKFDLVNLVDLDGDGDLDVITTDENEEGDGLGVVWYENPVR